MSVVYNAMLFKTRTLEEIIKGVIKVKRLNEVQRGETWIKVLAKETEKEQPKR